MSFVGPSYVLHARKADVQRSVNMFPVINEINGGKSVAYLESVPGLTPFSTDATVTGAILTNDGFYLLTEDGFRILLGNAVAPSALLMENGYYLLTEDGFRFLL